MSLRIDATTEELIAELSDFDGKAEIVGAEIVPMSPTGDFPSSAALAIYISLRDYSRKSGGRAYPDNVGYIVDLPNRTSFSPDASYFTGPRRGMKFLEGAPDFAVEVRSEYDYSAADEKQFAAIRVNYFAAGTKVVWDVDLQSDDVARIYRADDPENAVMRRRGASADAEPAVPGWTMQVDALFE